MGRGKKLIEAGLQDTPRFSGPAFRYSPGFEGGAPTGKTAGDVYRMEHQRGAIDDLNPRLANELDQFPAREIVWIARSKEDLFQNYGPTNDWPGHIEDIEDIDDVTEEVQNAPIIAENEDGVLVFLGWMGL